VAFLLAPRCFSGLYALWTLDVRLYSNMKPLALKLSIVTLLTAVLLCPLASEGASVEWRLSTVEAQLKQMKETAAFNNKRVADSLAVFEDVKQQINEMVGEIGKIRHELGSDAGDRTKNLQEMSHRLSRMEERLLDQMAMIADLSADLNMSTKISAKSQQSEDVLYQAAFSEMVQKKYKTAAKLFDQFVKKYPRSKLADNAMYWRGECYYALGDYEAAILEMQQVVKKYPKGDKAPAAILKQGYAFFQIKSYADSKAFLEKVIAEYPKSEEAIKAKEKIAEVNEILKLPPGKAKKTS